MIGMAPIYVVPIHLSSGYLLNPLSEKISATFHRDSTIASLPVDSSSTYDISRNQFYGLKRNEQLLRDRLEKETIHELGHTFGLIHCRNDLCVMNVSTYVENIDIKSSRLCQSCLRLYNERLKASRYFG